MRSRKIIVCAIALFMVVGAMSAVTFAATAQDEGETVYIAMQQDMPNFNYFDLASNTVWKDYVIGKFCFESLIGLDPAGYLYPMLALSTEFDDTVTPYQVNVTLRQGVLFHDGTEMTADDVVFSYMGLRDGTTLSSSIIDAFDADDDGVANASEVDGTIDADGNGEFEGVKKIDDYNVTFVMAKPYGQFFLTTLGIAILPEHIWAPDNVDTEGRLDTLWSHEDATIGTGPFYYQEGEQDVYRIMTRFTDYWGKNEITQSNHRLYPAHVKHIHYKLYSSLDTAILALKSRQVDHLPWTVTPGYVPDLAEDPNVDLRFVSDNGYFYLAFNMKREPMNNIYFRKAVSLAIDKETIVNRYMGGYGRAGDSCEPPFWADWYNDSVETYPFDPALTQAMVKLTTDGGFTLQGGTLYMPDGRPVPDLVILTPPADYDPIRIKAGELIAKNLRSLGISVIAKPLDFDALVAKMNAFDYDMLIIGWSLSSDPIGNVFDILGPKATQNYFAFWSTNNDNPLYNSIGDVSTMADAETQALADLVQIYADLAKTSFDRDEQILWTKAGQGAVADALPVNVLYYRVNIYAVSTAWEEDTWVNYLGELLNVYTMGELTPLGEEEVAGDEVTAMLFAPDKILMAVDMNASVVVVDGTGAPIEGADVTLTASENLTLSATSGTTDASGVFEFTMKAPVEGYNSLDATAAFGGNDFTYSKTIQCVKGIPNILFLDVTPEMTFLRVGENTVVHMNVTDGYGIAVQDASIKLDVGLMGYGSIDSATVPTNASGYGTMTYTAPADLDQALNKHLEVRLSLTATKTGYLTTNANTWTQFITIYNPTPNDWQFVEVQTVTDYAMDSVSNISTVTIHAFDMAGNVNGGAIHITYTNEDVLFNTVTDVTTNGAGLANFPVQFLDGIDTNATRITFQNETIPNSVAASLTLLYKGTTIPTPALYGGLISFAATPLLDPNGAGTLDFDVSLYDIDGNVPLGVTDAAIVIGEPPLGVVAGLDMTAPESYNALWDYSGLQLGTMYDESAMISGGYFRADLMSDAEINTLNDGLYATWQELYDDEWTFLGEHFFGLSTVNHTTMVGADITDGVGTFTVSAADLVLGDSVPHILVVPNGKMGFLVTSDYSNFYYWLEGPATLSTEFAAARAMSIISTTMTLDTPVMRSLGTGNTSNIDVGVYDQDNAPVVGAEVAVYVQVYGGSPFFSLVGTVPDTDAMGATTATIEALTEDGDGNPLSNPVKQPLYANPTYPDHATIFASSEIFAVPIQLFVLLDPSDSSFEAGVVTLEATVTDEFGNPVEGFDVEFIADNGTMDPDMAATSNGLATSEFEFLLQSGFQVASLSASVVKAGYIAAVNSIRIGVHNTPGVLDVTSIPATGHVSDDDSVTIEGTATEPTGIETFQLILDGGTPIDVTVEADGSFSYIFEDLDDGDHTVVVRMVDAANETTETTITFSVDTTADEFPWLWIIIAIVIILIVVILVIVMMRKRAVPTEPEEEEMIEEEAPAEEAPAEEAPAEEALEEEVSEKEPISEETPSEEAESSSEE
ncbi:MAG: Ig-like domain-containing protein [Thermoplasmata archaeon]|nr:Ig-like domain-containing protein [Thermoplasmata archaeon]